ncbi:MAG: protein kinase domain-containing protein, partial [Gaiellaceae bacterium]
VEGADLKTVIKREGALAPERTASIIAQVASALGVAHEKGLVHRDVKPANILAASGYRTDEAEHVYLSDFGVAKQSAANILTKTGMFVGTADYAPPEQIEGKTLDGRADIYALGCVLYECLTGAQVYDDKDSEVALMYAHLLEPPPAVTEKRPDLDGEVDGVVAKAMAKSRDDRYATVAEMATAVRAALVPRSAAATTAAPAGSPAQATVLAGSALGTAPAESAAPAPPEDAGAPRRRVPQPSRLGIVTALLVLALAAIAVLAALMLAGGDDEPEAAATSVAASVPVAADTTPGVLTLSELVPPAVFKGCRLEKTPAAGATEGAFCPPPAGATGFSPDRWEIASYPSSQALAKAYGAATQPSGVDPDTGRCSGVTWGGEGAWLHGPDKPGGRRACFFEGSDAVIVWTHEKLEQPTHQDILVVAREGGSDHAGLFNWWRFWHHRIGKAG